MPSMFHHDSLPDTLDKILQCKPQDSIQRLMDALLPLADGISCRRPRTLGSKMGEIYLLTDGALYLQRGSDDLILGVVRAPHVLGFAELLTPVEMSTRVKFSPESRVSVVSREKVRTTLGQQPALWEDVARILAFHLHFSVWRDLHLLSDSSYDAIRGKLFELEKQDEAFRSEVSISHYITHSTRLSRSTVLRILKALNEGGYIETHRGRLLNIVFLPQRY
ncbi:helix-turn-helix domain-containing protein [Klebsiella sp. CN_Kp098]|uniref:helix-turn-helix domain-containing protein n=1 Tax=unclassified Klebsiella TaxID=2608929 RepID=UPI0032B52E51